MLEFQIFYIIQIYIKLKPYIFSNISIFKFFFSFIFQRYDKNLKRENIRQFLYVHVKKIILIDLVIYFKLNLLLYEYEYDMKTIL